MRMFLSFLDNLWQFEQNSGFSVGNNLFGRLSDITDHWWVMSDNWPKRLLPTEKSDFWSSKILFLLRCYTWNFDLTPVWWPLHHKIYKVLLDCLRTFQGHKQCNTYFKSSFQFCKSQYIFLDDIMCVGFQLFYELSHLSLRCNKCFSFDISKCYSNTSRQPTLSFAILLE